MEVVFQVERDGLMKYVCGEDVKDTDVILDVWTLHENEWKDQNGRIFWERYYKSEITGRTVG